VLQVPFLESISVKVVIKDVKKVKSIGAKIRVVTVCQFRHARTMMFESRASHVIDSLGTVHVLTSTRKTR